MERFEQRNFDADYSPFLTYILKLKKLVLGLDFKSIIISLFIRETETKTSPFFSVFCISHEKIVKERHSIKTKLLIILRLLININL